MLHSLRLPMTRAVRRCAVHQKRLCTSAHQQAPVASAERVLTFAVDLHCEGCVKAVRRNLQSVSGIASLDVDLAAQSVLVQGSASTESLLAALTAGGRSARLTGQGSFAGFDATLASTLGMDERTLRQSLAAVAEFKGVAWRQGPVVGVVRFVQLGGSETRVEGVLDGLPPGRHTLAVHAYGDLTDGAASTGPPLADGVVATLQVDAAGRAELVDGKLNSNIQVWDVIGRALVLPELGVAAVIARSAIAGDNDKKICACDGTLIWHAGDIQP